MYTLLNVFNFQYFTNYYYYLTQVRPI